MQSKKMKDSEKKEDTKNTFKLNLKKKTYIF